MIIIDDKLHLFNGRIKHTIITKNVSGMECNDHGNIPVAPDFIAHIGKAELVVQ